MKRRIFFLFFCTVDYSVNTLFENNTEIGGYVGLICKLLVATEKLDIFFVYVFITAPKTVIKDIVTVFVTFVRVKERSRADDEFFRSDINGHGIEYSL